MKRRKFLVSLLLALLMLPLHVFAEEPTYAFTDAEVLARGQLYYSSLNQFFSNVANDNGNAAEVTLTGAIGFCDTDYWVQSEFDARVAQGTTYGPCLYIEYVVTDQNGHSKTGYSYDLLPVGGHFNEGLAKLNYTTAVKNFSGGSGISILGNNFVKDSLNYKVRIDLSDYAAKGYSTTKTQVDAARAAKVASIVETPERYYANLEKLLMTFDSNTQTNEVIVCVKGIYTDDELASISYTDDSKITDHYAIVPTGQVNEYKSLTELQKRVYELIVRRFLSIFYPPAVYQKFSLTLQVKEESFFASFKVLIQEGYLKVTDFSFKKENTAPKEDKENENESADEKCDAELTNLLTHLKKGDTLSVDTYEIKEGETSPPKRYTSGSIILTMENAGQFIEDEELRAQIKGSGIGTSATRAEILKKLVNIEYLALNKKTQVLTPTQMGEMIYDVVSDSIRPLLNPALTASWEKGLTMVADGVITPDDYMGKLTDFVGRRTVAVRGLNNQGMLWRQFQATEEFYQKKQKQSNAKNKE